MLERSSNQAKQATEAELSEQIAQLRSDVSEIAKTLRNLGQSKVEQVAGKAADKAAELSAAGKRRIDGISSSIESLEAEAADRVRTNPVQSLAVAAALGLVLGLVVRRS